MRIRSNDSSSLPPARTGMDEARSTTSQCRIGKASVSQPEVSMRKVYESIVVILAAGLAAAIALIELPIHSTEPGTVVGGGDLFAAPPPTSAPALPPLPPLLFPPGSSTPVPIESPATSAPSLPPGAQPRQGMTEASSPAMGVLGTSLAQQAPTPTTKPLSAPAPRPRPASNKPKPPPTAKKAKPLRPTKPPQSTKPKPPPTSNKPKPPPPTGQPKSEVKPKDGRKATSAGALNP
jgi:hypothetical protein